MSAITASRPEAVLERVRRSGWPGGCPDITRAYIALRDALEDGCRDEAGRYADKLGRLVPEETEDEGEWAA